MPLKIPVGNKYITSVDGFTLKPVTCSYCGCHFVYFMKRQATGEDTSWLWLNNTGAASNANDHATNDLNYKLQHDFNVISCPDCGMYQNYMVKGLKKHAWKTALRNVFWFSVIGFIFILSGSLLFKEFVPWIKIVLLIMAMGLWGWAVIKSIIPAYKLKPNEDAYKRKGRTFSENYPVYRLAELEELQKANDSDRRDQHRTMP